MNNRFGTWPACTGEAVTAALRAGLPTFDGCAVSQNSWRRGALAACMRWRKKANKQKARAEISLWGRHTHPGSAGARQVTLQHGLRGLTPRETALTAPQPPLTPRRGPWRRCTPHSATSQGVFSLWWGSAAGPSLLQLLKVILQQEPTSLVPSRQGMPLRHHQPIAGFRGVCVWRTNPHASLLAHRLTSTYLIWDKAQRGTLRFACTKDQWKSL